jgi:hypothetical protein
MGKNKPGLFEAALSGRGIQPISRENRRGKRGYRARDAQFSQFFRASRFVGLVVRILHSPALDIEMPSTQV